MSYMVNLVVDGRLAVVVGGGEVAARKAQDLLVARASVTVIAPHACRRIVALAEEGRIQAHFRPYTTGDLAGAFVAVAATDDEQVNTRVAEDAVARNVLVNVVDRSALCTFTVPATVYRGDLTLSVATEGRCPALAGILREELEERYGPEYSELVGLFGELRHRMIALAWDGRRMRRTLTEVYRDGVIEFVAAGDRQRLNDFLRSRTLDPQFRCGGKAAVPAGQGPKPAAPRLRVRGRDLLSVGSAASVLPRARAPGRQLPGAKARPDPPAL